MQSGARLSRVSRGNVKLAGAGSQRLLRDTLQEPFHEPTCQSQATTPQTSSAKQTVWPAGGLVGVSRLCRAVALVGKRSGCGAELGGS